MELGIEQKSVTSCMDIKMDLSASSPESDDFKVKYLKDSRVEIVNELISRYASFVTIEQPAIISMQ